MTKGYKMNNNAALVVAAMTAACAAVANAAYIPEPKPVKSEIEISAFYYPGTEHMPEWDMVDQTLPKIKPLLGWYDEGDPENIDWQIKWAVEHGISSFCVDWYWKQGTQRLNHWIKAYYKAKFRKYLKWYIMYANHNPPGSHSTEDQIAVTKWWIDNYFKTPEYYTIDGKPVVVLWQYERLDNDFIAEAKAKGETLKRGEGVKRAFAISERMVKEAGLPGICWINMNNRWKHTVEENDHIKNMGFVAQVTYNLGGSGPYYMAPEARTEKDTPQRSSFDLMVAATKKIWQNADVDPSLPFWPLLPTGWNDLPRSFQVARVTYDRTPEKFSQVCVDARKFCKERGLKRVIVAPLNEWQEGSYIEPNEEYGFAMYDALRDAFCEKPAEGWPKNLTPADVGRPKKEYPPMFYSPVQEWNFDNSPEGWFRQPYGCYVTRCKEGSLYFVTTGKDNNYQIRQRLKPFAAKNYRTFKIRMKLIPNEHFGLGRFIACGKRPEMRLKWGLDHTPIISKDFFVDDRHVFYAEVIPDGEWHEYEMPLYKTQDWNSNVNELWFEAINATNFEVYIDWMRFEK